jgi:hypothetical protein
LLLGILLFQGSNFSRFLVIAHQLGRFIANLGQQVALVSLIWFVQFDIRADTPSHLGCQSEENTTDVKMKAKRSAGAEIFSESLILQIFANR